MSLGPPNLAPVVASFSFPVVRRRYAGPAVTSRGLVRETSYTDTTIQAHVHDAPADVLERVFPGQEGVRAIQFYASEADLRTVEDGSANAPADSLIYRGVEFEIVTVSEWAATGAGSRSYLEGVARQVER